MHFNHGKYCSHCTANTTMRRNVESLLQAGMNRFPFLVSIWKSLVLMEVGESETEFDFQNPDSI